MIAGTVPNSCLEDTDFALGANDCNTILHAMKEQHFKHIVQIKEVLSDLHFKHAEDISKRQAEHEARMVALVKGMPKEFPPNAPREWKKKDEGLSSPPEESCQKSKSPEAEQSSQKSESQTLEQQTQNDSKARQNSSLSVVPATPQQSPQQSGNKKTAKNVEVSSEAKLLEAKKRAKEHRAWSRIEGKTFTDRAQKIMETPVVECTIGFVILSNTVFVAAQADYTAKTLTEGGNSSWAGIGLFFQIFFSAEIILRMLIEQKRFLFGHNRHWNIFDFIVVSISTIEHVFSSSSSGSVTRVLRTLRLMRVARFVRVLRFFHELRTMVMGILQSFMTLIWALLLLIMNMFMFSVYMTPIVAYERIEIRERNALDPEYDMALEASFGSVPTTIYSLYKAVTGGDDWSGYADLLFEIDISAGVLFCFYVAFTTFAVLNVVSGVFIGNAFKLIEDDTDHTIMEQTESRRKVIEDMKKVFRKADFDRSGKIGRAEFEEHINDPLVQAYFRQLGLEVDDVSVGMFDLLDFDNDNQLNMEEFVEGCLHVRGTASSLDVERCHFSLRKILTEFNNLKNDIQSQRASFQTMMQMLETTLKCDLV